jgi:hypothetical protein
MSTTVICTIRPTNAVSAPISVLPASPALQRFGTFATSDFLPSAELALSMTSSTVSASSLKRADIVLLRGAAERTLEVWAVDQQGIVQRRVGTLLAGVSSWLHVLLDGEKTKVLGALEVRLSAGGAPRYRLLLAVFMLRPVVDAWVPSAAAVGDGKDCADAIVRRECLQKLFQACASFAATGVSAGAARTSTMAYKNKSSPATNTTTTPPTATLPSQDQDAIRAPAQIPIVPMPMPMPSPCGSDNQNQTTAYMALTQEERMGKTEEEAEARVEPDSKKRRSVPGAADAAAAVPTNGTCSNVSNDSSNIGCKGKGNNDGNNIAATTTQMFSINLSGARRDVPQIGKQAKINGVPLVTASAFSAAFCADELASLPRPVFKAPLRVTAPKKRHHAALLHDATTNKTLKVGGAQEQRREACVDDDAASLLLALAN